MNYIANVLKKPNVVEALKKDLQKNCVNHFTYTEPCDPGFFVYISPNRIFSLTKVEVFIDVIVPKYDLPMKHIKAGNKKIYITESEVLGKPTKLVLIPERGTLKVMFEQQISKKSK